MIFSWLHALLGVTMFISCMVMHELGHLLYFHWGLKKDVDLKIKRASGGFKVIIGEAQDYFGLTKKEKYNVYAYGIAAGFIPLAGLSILLPSYILIVPIYFYMCKSDFKSIWRLVKRG